MPQLQLPIFPAGVTEINSQIAVQTEAGRVFYLHGHLPVFQHEEKEVRRLREFTSQMIAVGTNSVLRANVAANNRGGGFYVYCPSSVIGNSASGNVANFVLITTGGNCTVSENSAP